MPNLHEPYPGLKIYLCPIVHLDMHRIPYECLLCLGWEHSNASHNGFITHVLWGE